jgi:hypothetical protein
MAKNIEDCKARLDIIIPRIEKLEAQQNGGYTAQVARSFHLGMVGGSGRNTARLNRRRGAELDRTIDRAKVLTELYKERNYLEARIKDIEDDGPAKRAEHKKKINEAKAEYWRRLKIGDELNIGNPNGNPTITKKSAKSVQTGPGCVWKASEIIGKEAAALL